MVIIDFLIVQWILFALLRFTMHYYVILSLLLQFVKTHWCDWHMWQLLLVQHTPLFLEGMYSINGGKGGRVMSSQTTILYFMSHKTVYLISATCLGLSTLYEVWSN